MIDLGLGCIYVFFINISVEYFMLLYVMEFLDFRFWFVYCNRVKEWNVYYVVLFIVIFFVCLFFCLVVVFEILCFKLY